MNRVLIVAAHPDDEMLGCGGTTWKWAQQGDEIYSLVLGEGITSRSAQREQADPEKLRSLHACHDRVAAFLGYKKHWLHDFPDNRFDTLDLLEIIKVVERVKQEVEPQIVLTHFAEDLNIDHRLTFQAVLTACRPLGSETVRELYSFEIPSSTEWNSPSAPGFRPTMFVDISTSIERKIEAMKLYDSEVGVFPHPRSPEALRIIAQRWGIACGRPYAEAFVLIRRIC